MERTEQYLSILQGTIRQKPIGIVKIEYSESRDGSTGWSPFCEKVFCRKDDVWYRFRTEFVIPEEYSGKHVKCDLITGRDGKWNALNPQLLVYVNGCVVQALDWNHNTFELTKNANAGEKYTIEFEEYTGKELAKPQPGLQDNPLKLLLHAYCHEQVAEDLYYDLIVPKMAAEMYPENDYDRIQIENYLTAALNLLDCRVPSSEEYFASVENAHRYMQEEFYGKFCGHEEMVANCIGHSHIDVAWKWRLEKTRAKAVRSFATELALLEEYPEHFFTSSQPQLYQFVKEECPEIYERIKEYVKKGRWEIEGAMWLEADCNLSSGESLIRQILHGKRFMQKEFGVDSRILWLPDVFGYSAALPQILRKTGVDAFVTSKIHWSETNHFPYDTFMWKGVDGSEVFTQYITAGESNSKLGDQKFYSTYNAELKPIAVTKGWEIYQQKEINNEILVTVGYGDGGGGLTREMLEMNRRMKNGIPGVPKTRITTVTDTIARIKKNVKGKKLPKWFGELYLENHRATYTTRAKTKKNNRRAEFLLQGTETVALMNKVLYGGDYDKKTLYDSWTTVLLNQFHDIIPGSSVQEVYDDSDAQYQVLFDCNKSIFESAVKRIATNVSKAGILVYNPAGIRQSGIVTCEDKRYFVKDVPAFGWKVIDCDETKVISGQYQEKVSEIFVSVSHMENEFFALDLDEKGTFISIYDKVNKRQILKDGQRGNVLQVFDDHPYSHDNWNLSPYYQEKMWEMDDVTDMQVQEKDGLSASVKITRHFLSSVIEQTITIYKDIPRIDFDTNMDWHEHFMFVKAAFPVDILSDKAAYEIQYGAVERPTHSNTTWDEAKFEVCAQKWADYGEAGYGVALLNDCKYGYDIHDGVMRLSLIKCGMYPDPDADQGFHQFRYALMPHAEDWREAGIAKEAYAFNCPLIAMKTNGEGTAAAEYGFVSANRDNIFITVAKEACDSDDIILRAYESQGRRTLTEISCGFEVKDAAEVDMMEKEVYQRLSVSDNCFAVEFRPYEIKTFQVKY